MSGLHVKRYALPLVTPLRVGRQTLTVREGAIIELRPPGTPDRIGYGEVAPLPGLSSETLDEAMAAIPRIETFTDCQSLAELVDRTRSLPPSTRFGVECAWLEAHTDPRYPLASGIADSLPIPRERAGWVESNGLLDGTPAQIGAMTREALDAYSTWKVKVGRRPLAEERAILHTLDQRLDPDQRLRLDANRAFSIDQVLDLCAECSPDRIEYLEEPLQDATQLAALHDRSKLPIALDETLVERLDQPDHTLAIPGVSAWVLKPTLLGGVDTTLAAARRALALDPTIGCVVSSCFESGVGLRALAHLAAALPTRDCAAGLSTGSWFGADTIEPPFATRIEDGWIGITPIRSSDGNPT